MWILFSGQAERERVHAAVPLRRLLRLPEAEGAGVPEHHLDRRMRGSAAPGQDRQLHSNLLKASLRTSTLSMSIALASS